MARTNRVLSEAEMSPNYQKLLEHGDAVEVGDLLATPTTGAYGYSMASNYNEVTRPAVVFVREGSPRLVVRRETYEDLVRLDVV